ncbi:serine hydrolase [Paenibacillus sp. ACRRX]|uniref:serine hydrolase n=1 Tax=Paenibacillus sp. ACRRX TaxID=2918206 RepID=UPI001EF5AE8D|nr:serine hydrolase [Paenibacillus sp. ACRRX]MCG7407198.1 serine hydrolase [Paenibacillus sp. ACRRX]
MTIERHAAPRRSGKKALITTIALATAITFFHPLCLSDVSAAESPTTASHQTLPTTAGPTSPQEVEAFADKLFASSKMKDIPGAVFVVVKDGKLLLNKGYGYSDVKAKKPMDPDKTVMRVASITKPFTTAVLLQLAEQGKLDLKKDISAYLEDLHIPRKVEGDLTAEHLMTHTSGFEFPDPPLSTHLTTNAEYLRHYTPTVVRKPGESYMYDNMGFSLQGYIVEKITGEPFHKYAKKSLLDPLGMTHSSFIMTPDTKTSLSLSYDSNGEPMPPYEINPADSPDGSLLSTGGDMAKFMFAMLNAGSYNGQQILKQESVRSMLEVKVSSVAELPNTSYGFESLFRENFNGQKVLAKGGDLPGFSSWMWLLPDQKTGAFVIFNRNDAANAYFREHTFTSFMNHYYPDNKPAPTILKSTQQELQQFAGAYRDLRLGFELIRVETKPEGVLELSSSTAKQQLQQVGPLLFKTKSNKLIGFKRDPKGNITYMDQGNVSWLQKLPAPSVTISDINENHPYRNYIDDLLLRGGIELGTGNTFLPDQELTRGDFISLLISSMHIRKSDNTSSFADIKGHKYAKDIQTAVEFGLVTGTHTNQFSPDTPITRQEAAVVIWRLVQLMGADPLDAKLVGETDKWALTAVKYAVASQIYGPEVSPRADGSVDYGSKRNLERKEAAALISLLLSGPIS